MSKKTGESALNSRGYALGSTRVGGARLYEIGHMEPVDRVAWHSSMIEMDTRTWNQSVCGLQGSRRRGGEFSYFSSTGFHQYDA
jgi:hypothetical protein